MATMLQAGPVEIPLAEIELRASRSSGPGGQHANVTASRIEAVFEIDASQTLSAEQRARLRHRYGARVTAVAQDARSQARNRELAEARRAVVRCLETRPRVRAVTLAEAQLQDGQRLLAFNDLFIGAKSHVSARYTLRLGARHERQSSSGVLVSTGAGSTGWMSSVFNMAAGVTTFAGGAQGTPLRLAWSDRRLLYAVREPFISRRSSAGIVAGLLDEGTELMVESHMPSGGVIFSDGIEADFVAFNSGAVARIHPAARRAYLVASLEPAGA